MKMKNSCTLQKCKLLKKRPIPETCHHWGPNIERMIPLITTQTRATRVMTPKTYTHEPT
jgi:hypothetical protein